MNTEAAITINGKSLTVAQSMTVRVALTSFHSDCQNYRLEGLIFDGYMADIRAILAMINEGDHERFMGS